MFDERESKKIELTAELAALQRQLAGLELAPLQLNRDELMFAAGRAAERSERKIAATQRVGGSREWLWPAATAMMTAASVVLAAMLVWKDGPLPIAQTAKPRTASEKSFNAPTSGDLREVERLAVGSSSSIWAPAPTSGYLGVRYVALTQGVGALGADPFILGDNGSEWSEPPSQPATARELLDEFLPPGNENTHTRS